MNFSQICRVCLESNKQNYDIFTSLYVKRNTLYSEMLSTCTKLKPYEDDGFPRMICKDCSRQLKRTYAFNLQCEESEIKLKKYKETSVLEHKSNVDNDTLEIKEEFPNEVKSEEEDKTEENNGKLDLLDLIGDIPKDGTKDDIKVELTCNDDAYDSGWDADDDNILLREIKEKKRADANCNGEDVRWNADILKQLNNKVKKTVPEDSSDKPKKKRGRKKKVYMEGELPSLPESKLPHQCDICGKFLSTKSNLKAHKICHTDLRPYKCSACPATFRAHSALFQHKKVHSGETPYHCEYCPKQFSRRTGLVNHIRMHTGEKQYSCEICFKHFVQSGQLLTHMKRHKGDKTFLCQDCGKGFPIKADLQVHQRIHSGEKPYSCHLCTKTFTTSGNLSIHVRIHNKEVRYNCKECHRGFVTCSSYNVHLKRHKGQRDYHCECGKTFYTSSALKQHKIVHTGEKKYQCKICDRKFTQTSHLSRHFKRDHAKPNVPIPSSDHYKRILHNNSESVLGIIDNSIQLLAPIVHEAVKCEGS